MRLARKLSQEAAAESMGIHAKHLQRIEQGTANLTFATLVAICAAYKLPLAALFEATTSSRAERILHAAEAVNVKRQPARRTPRARK